MGWMTGSGLFRTWPVHASNDWKGNLSLIWDAIGEALRIMWTHELKIFNLQFKYLCTYVKLPINKAIFYDIGLNVDSSVLSRICKCGKLRLLSCVKKLIFTWASLTLASICRVPYKSLIFCTDSIKKTVSKSLSRWFLFCDLVFG